jgi:hypothetical protein
VIIASVYEGFKRTRIFRYSFHSFRCCLDFRIIRITPFGCSGKLIRLPRSNVDDK